MVQAVQQGIGGSKTTMPDASAPAVLGAALAAAQRRARAYAVRLDRTESQFGIVRLVLTLTALAVLVGLFAQLTTVGASVGVVLFGLFLLSLSAAHRVIRTQKELWAARCRSLAAQAARQSRDFAALCQSAGSEGLLTPWSLEHVARQAPQGHPFAVDLDVNRLVFPLLDTCATPEASARLHDLLLAEEPSEASVAAASERRRRVDNIRKYGRLLRDLDVSRFMPDVLSAWAQGKVCRLADLEILIASQQTRQKTLVYLGFALVSVAAWGALLIPAHVAFVNSGAAEVYVGSLLRYALFPIVGLGVFKGLLEAAGALRRRMSGLDLLMRDVDLLRNEPALAGLAAEVTEARGNLSWMRLALDLYGARSNPVFWLFVHIFVPYDAIIGCVVWFMMSRLHARFAKVTEGLIELDCDAALARFARENPDFVFSSFVSGSQTKGAQQEADPTRLEALGMGHPLLPRRQRVCNSVAWHHDDRMIILTGSNMSGKSTFLRTFGVNALLHNIGAPVCAERFAAPPLRLLCAIRVDDALEAGTSYFYAEVKRLAALLQALNRADRDPDQSGSNLSYLNVYLIDEIFRGTNNRERFLGSLYTLRGFMATSGIGIVTTHDLALTRLASVDESRSARNMHFRETIEHKGSEARLQFDFLLREGPCPTTNALRIMHAEGLPVPSEVSPEAERALMSGDSDLVPMGLS